MPPQEDQNSGPAPLGPNEPIQAAVPEPTLPEVPEINPAPSVDVGAESTPEPEQAAPVVEPAVSTGPTVQPAPAAPVDAPEKPDVEPSAPSPAEPSPTDNMQEEPTSSEAEQKTTVPEESTAPVMSDVQAPGPQEPSADAASMQQPQQDTQGVQTATPQPPAANSAATSVVDMQPAKGGSGKKVALVVTIIIGVLLALGAAGFFAMNFLGSTPVPTYSELQEATLSGYTASESGIKFKHPAELELVESSSDTEAQYHHYNLERSGGVPSDDSIYSGIIVSTQSLRTGDISMDERVKAIVEFQNKIDSQGGFETFFESDIDNIVVVKNEVDEQNAALNFEITGTSKPDENGETDNGTFSGKFVVGNGYLYTIVVSAEQEVWDTNKTVFMEILNTAEFDQ